MSKTTIQVRGRTFAVECKSGSQLAFVIAHHEKQSDEQLDRNALEYTQEMQRRGIWTSN